MDIDEQGLAVASRDEQRELREARDRYGVMMLARTARVSLPTTNRALARERMQPHTLRALLGAARVLGKVTRFAERGRDPLDDDGDDDEVV